MIWLASFPRSGNTFIRIVLHEVYGLKSSAFRLESEKQKDKEYFLAPVVKTHVLPHQLVPGDLSIPIVYLVRDGRDSVVSMAHHGADIINPGSDYYENMKSIILARQGTHFGGWGKNVMAWLPRADLVLHFEDLITDPIGTLEELRTIMDLPEPRPEKLPTFEDLRSKETPYGPKGRKTFSKKEYLKRKKQFFRRGKAGAWQDEMPFEYQKMFWFLHGDAMRAAGYTDGEVKVRPTPGMLLYKYLDHSFDDRGRVKQMKDKLIERNWTFDDP
jgi:hypothetical protein